MNQLELQTKICSRRQARENASWQSHDWICFAPDWLIKQHSSSDWLEHVANYNAKQQLTQNQFNDFRQSIQNDLTVETRQHLPPTYQSQHLTVVIYVLH